MSKQPAQELTSLGAIIKGRGYQEILARWEARAEESRKNGSTNSESGTKYDCPDCQDTEVLLQPDGWTSRFCHCKEWKAARRMLQRSGIEGEFQRVTFDHYKTEGKHRLFAVAKQISQGYVELAEQDYRERTASEDDTPTRSKYNGMGLCGEPGAGKTQLLFAIGNELLARKVPVLYFQHREEFDRLKANDFEGSGQLYERVKNFRGVVLWDDLFKTQKRDKFGNRTAHDWEVEASWTMINYRIFKDLPIAWSTEWRPIELMNLDRSTAGRLIERCKHPSDPRKDRLVTFQLSKAEIEKGADPIKTFDHRFMRLGE